MEGCRIFDKKHSLIVILSISRETHQNIASKLTIWQPSQESQQNSLDIKEQYHAKSCPRAILVISASFRW
jgi:hypothetical protein